MVERKFLHMQQDHTIIIVSNVNTTKKTLSISAHINTLIFSHFLVAYVNWCYQIIIMIVVLILLPLLLLLLVVWRLENHSIFCHHISISAACVSETLKYLS